MDTRSITTTEKEEPLASLFTMNTGINLILCVSYFSIETIMGEIYVQWLSIYQHPPQISIF